MLLAHGSPAKAVETSLAGFPIKSRGFPAVAPQTEMDVLGPVAHPFNDTSDTFVLTSTTGSDRFKFFHIQIHIFMQSVL